MDSPRLFVTTFAMFAVVCLQVSTSSLTVEPKDTEVHEGNTVVLNCIFSGNIRVNQCWWKRNTITLSISGRYKYVSGQGGNNNNDCSIEILNSTIKDDNGEWQCGSNGPYGHMSGQSSTVLLTVKPVPTSPFKEEPESQPLTPNDSIILHCILHNEFSTCYWIRNHVRVIMGNRYQFINGTGKNTRDCSIIINRAQLIDSGTWQCVANGDHMKRGYLSKVAIVAVIHSEGTFVTIPTCPECPVCPTVPLYVQTQTHPPSAQLPIEATQVTKPQVDEYHYLHSKSTIILWIVILLLAIVSSVSMTLNIKFHTARRQNPQLNPPEEHLLNAKENYVT